MSKAKPSAALLAILVAGACMAIGAQPGAPDGAAPPATHFAVGSAVAIALSRSEPPPVQFSLRSPMPDNARDAAPIVHFAPISFPSEARRVLWRPAPDGSNEFGMIPTRWTTRPQLLPGTWDVETVFAGQSTIDRNAAAAAAAVLTVAPQTTRTSAEYRR